MSIVDDLKKLYSEEYAPIDWEASREYTRRHPPRRHDPDDEMVQYDGPCFVCGAGTAQTCMEPPAAETR